MVELIAEADAAVDSTVDFVQSQPMADDSAPLNLTDADRAVSLVGPSQSSKRATAAG